MAKTTRDITSSFVEVNGKYEASVDVSDVYNVHVENGGCVTVKQKTAGNSHGGTYQWNQDIVDEDIAGLVFPKSIKVICEKQPTSCVISIAN